jgi:hypothetical protein
LLVKEELTNFTNNEDDFNNDNDVLHRNGGTSLVIIKSLLTPNGV